MAWCAAKYIVAAAAAISAMFSTMDRSLRACAIAWMAWRWSFTRAHQRQADGFVASLKGRGLFPAPIRFVESLPVARQLLPGPDMLPCVADFLVWHDRKNGVAVGA